MRLALVAALVAALAPAPARAGEGGSTPYLEELLVRARASRLAEDPGWLRLGHWRRTPMGWKSEADGPKFFRSLRGKTHPGAELEATLRGLFDARPVGDELEDAQCRFPARSAFLAAHLGIDPARLERRRCPRLEEFLEHLQAKSVTLVFSSYYLNNPVSSFGHTFLRVNKAEEARSGKHFELLDYGIDYSATPDTKNPLLYAVKGLTGGFQGHFNQLAYYYKVGEYAEAESRDLWEYDLALKPDEVSLLTLHIWELGGTWFDYWYLDENCSYHILDAIEAVAPRLSLLEHVGAVVLPSDTVKALFRNPGLVRAVHYRPSIRTQFETRVGALEPRERVLVGALYADASTRLPVDLAPSRQAAVLDAAVDLVDLRHFRNLVVGRAPEAARDRQVLLERRSQIRVQSPPLDIRMPVEQAPDRGHGSFRAGVGGGVSSRDGGLVELDLRVALHDLGDPPEGFPSLSQIEFLPTRIRLAPQKNLAQVDEVWALRIVSLNGVSRFDLRPSWRAKFGAATVRDAACHDCLAPQVEAGTGFTFARIARVLDLYGGVDAAFEWSPHLSGIDGSEVRAGIGPGGIARIVLGTRAALLADARWRWLPGAAPDRTFDLRGALRLHLVRDLSLALEARRAPAEDVLSAALLAYF
jgi:hypothetical protein